MFAVAVRVVLDVRDLRVDAVFVVAAEVDHPVGPLVAAALVAGGDATVRVTATLAVQRACISDFSGVERVISAKSETLAPRRPGVVGLYLRIPMSV